MARHLTADQAIERYFRHRAGAGHVRSSWIAKSSGWCWAEACATCKNPNRVMQLLDPKLAGMPGLTPEHWLMRCSKCGTEWPRVEVSEISSRRSSREGRATRVDVTEDKMLEYATLAVAIWTTPHGPRWTKERWAQHLDALLDQVLNGTLVAVIARRRHWELRTAERVLHRARAAIEDRL